MFRKLSIPAGLILASCLISTPTLADQLQMKPLITDVKPGDPLYVNGMSKSQIANRFGEPREKIAAVGDPPISQWVYDDFTVYFEYDLALHLVKHKHNTEKAH